VHGCDMKTAFRVLRILARIFGALVLLAFALFCVFGFLASFEPGNGWQWKAGYGALGCACLFGAVTLLLPRRTVAKPKGASRERT
jgi:hypothetical protein